MKKMLLSLCLAVTGLMAQANSLTVYNLLNVPITLTFWGYNADGSVFLAMPATLPSGPTVFADPTQLPGVTNATPGGRIVSGYGVCNPYDLSIGSPAGGVQSHQTVGSLNLCNNNAVFDMNWSESAVAPYNAVLLIF